MSMFGNPQNTTGQSGGGLYGSTTGQQQSGTSLFGSSGQPSLFGSIQQQPQQQSAPSPFGNAQGSSTSGNLFGSTTATTGGGGLFGGVQQNTGGGLFGSTTGQQQQPASGGLFGNTTQQQQQPSSGAGLFGQTQPQQQPSTSLFGSTATQQPSTSGTGLFGTSTQQPATGGPFGSTTRQQPAGGSLFGSTAQSQPATSGGLFGSTMQQQQPSTTSGLFGSTTQQPATGGGLFGSTTQQQQPSSSGGLFGSATQPQQLSTGGGLFGSSTTQPAAGGPFASTAQQQQPTSTSGLFGSATQAQQQQPTTGGSLFGTMKTNGGGLFGGGPAGSIFGSTTSTFPAASAGGGTSFLNQVAPPQQRTSLFGTSNGGPLFGGATSLGSSTLSASALGRTASATAQQQFDALLQTQRLVQKLITIKESWNPQSSQCRFQYNFYNLVDPSQIHMYGRPANVVNDTIWDKAVRENPDPSCLVPVIAVGFNDLRERVEAQTKQAEKHQTQVKDLRTRTDAINEQHTLSNLPRLLRASTQQTQIQQRLMTLVQHLHLLIPALRSSSIRPEEEQLRGRLEECEEEIRRTRLKAKLNELWASLGAINASRQGTKNVNGTGEWAVVDEEGMAQISQILAEQQTGLAHLTKILQKMLNDLDIITGRSRRSSPPNEQENIFYVHTVQNGAYH